MEFTDCAELDPRGQACLAPAILTRLQPLQSTDGPVELVKTRCLDGHVLCMPTSYLITPVARDPDPERHRRRRLTG